MVTNGTIPNTVVFKGMAKDCPEEVEWVLDIHRVLCDKPIVHISLLEQKLLKSVISLTHIVCASTVQNVPVEAVL
jgi:hypothetical protein